MRASTIVVCVALAGCARGSGTADSAAATSRDSVIVAGPAAVLTTQVAPSQSAPTGSTTPASAPPKKGNTVVPITTPPESLRAGPPPAGGGARADSVRGIVSVVGTSIERRVMVAERGTQRRVEVVGALARLVGHVAGTDVSVAGTLAGTQLTAASFVVRAVDNQPAIDGTLKTEGGLLYIVTANGTRTRIAAPPPPLVGQDGARVWITGDPARAVSSFGFIDPPR